MKIIILRLSKTELQRDESPWDALRFCSCCPAVVESASVGQLTLESHKRWLIPLLSRAGELQ